MCCVSPLADLYARIGTRTHTCVPLRLMSVGSREPPRLQYTMMLPVSGVTSLRTSAGATQQGVGAITLRRSPAG